MNTDILARGFTLTPALRDAVEREVDALQRRLPGRIGSISVRLFDANGPRGGPDKGCLVHARLVRNGPVVVATDLDLDLYQAIGRAFAKLQRGARSALERSRLPLRRRATLAPASPGTEVRDRAASVVLSATG